MIKTVQMLAEIPEPMATFQQFNRFNHFDIPDLSDEELKEELWSLRSLLFWLPPRHWIRDRVRELGKEYGRRHYAQNTQNAPRLQPPKKTEDFY